MSVDQLEGTILSQGAGTGGNRTRGRSGIDAGSRQRAATGAAPKMLSARSLNQNNMGGIDTSAAHIRPEKLEATMTYAVKESPIISPQTMQHVGDMLSNAADRYADRVATVDAQNALLKFEEFSTDLFYGNPDKKSTGFQDRLLQEATTGYSVYSSELNKQSSDLLASLSPEARAKALVRLVELKNGYLRKGAAHVDRQQLAVEENTKKQAIESAAMQLSRGNLDVLTNTDGGHIGGLNDRVLELTKNDVVEAAKLKDAVIYAGAKKLYTDKLMTYSSRDDGAELAQVELEAYRAAVIEHLSVEAAAELNKFVLKGRKDVNAEEKARASAIKAALKEKQESDLLLAAKSIFKDNTPYSSSYDLAERTGIPYEKAKPLYNQWLSEKGEGSNGLSDIQGFMEEITHRRADGKYFTSVEDLIPLANKHGLSTTSDWKYIEKVYKEGRGAVSSDRKLLDNHLSTIYKELDRINAVDTGKFMYSLDGSKPLFKVDPASAELKGKILDIVSSNRDKTPMQQYEAVQEYLKQLKDEAKKALDATFSGAGSSKYHMEDYAFGFNVRNSAFKVQQYITGRQFVEREAMLKGYEEIATGDQGVVVQDSPYTGGGSAVQPQPLGPEYGGDQPTVSAVRNTASSPDGLIVGGAEGDYLKKTHGRSIGIKEYNEMYQDLRSRGYDNVVFRENFELGNEVYTGYLTSKDGKWIKIKFK